MLGMRAALSCSLRGCEKKAISSFYYSIIEYQIRLILTNSYYLKGYKKLSGYNSSWSKQRTSILTGITIN